MSLSDQLCGAIWKMSLMVECLTGRQTQPAYKFCLTCKKLAPHVLIWLGNESVLLPTQFGNRLFSYVTVQSTCLICGTQEVKYVKIKGKLNHQNSKIKILLIPNLFLKPRFQVARGGEPPDRGEHPQGEETSSSNLPPWWTE